MFISWYIEYKQYRHCRQCRGTLPELNYISSYREFKLYIYYVDCRETKHTFYIYNTNSYLPVISETYVYLMNDPMIQLYSLLLTGPSTQNNLPWLSGSKLHSKLWLLICNTGCPTKHDSWYNSLECLLL